MKLRSFEYTIGGQVHRLPMPASGSLVIGSSPGSPSPNVLRLEEPGIEGTHCVIGRTKAGGLAIKNLSAGSELLVNGESTIATRLRTGDEIRMGDIMLMVCGGSEVEGAAVASGGHETADVSATRATTPPPASSASTPERGRAPKGKLPDRIGGFRIERRLGKGGMGEVLLAVQESLARQVALKLLKPKLGADADFVSRFQAEARAAAALNHPNVVHVYDVGIADGRHYLAMEFMAGGTLEDRVRKQGPLGWAEVQHVLLETAKGLSYAEERGIVHRDIKPDNLMIDAGGAIKLADLGLATGNKTDSADGKILGTPHFMAPEQARGGSVDHRADLYALGATAWRLLTAMTPFEGETTRDILRAHFTEDVRPPSAIVPGIPASLDAIILRLMAREPNDRFASARALSLALEEGMADVSDSGSKFKRPLIAIAALSVVAICYSVFSDGTEKTAGNGGATSVLADAPLTPAISSDGTSEPSAFPAMPAVETDDSMSSKVLPGSDDQALKNLENLAEQAYRGLQLIEDPESRITALSDLASSFPGTSTATEALAEHDVLKVALEVAAARAIAEADKLNELLSAFTVVDNQAEKISTGAPADPDALLAAILEVKGPGDPINAAKFEAERDKRLSAALDAASAHAESQIQAANALAEAGDYLGYRTTLEALLPYFDVMELEVEPESAVDGEQDSADKPAEDVPEESSETRILERASFTPNARQDEATGTNEGPKTPEWMLRLAPLGLHDFLMLKRQATDLLAGAELREIAYLQALSRADETILAGAFATSGAQSFEQRLVQMQLSEAADMLSSIEDRLQTPASRAAVQELASELRKGAAVHAILIETYAKGEWRSDTLPDPNGNSKPATSVTKSGVTLTTRSGTKDVLWAQYAVDPLLVDKLFRNRLRRDLTLEEKRGVASLCRVAAVLNTALEADRILMPNNQRKFEADDVESMITGFEITSTWAVEDQAAGQATQRELLACSILGKALLAKAAGKPSTASAHLEHLLRNFRGSLLVLLLSDGSDWRAQ